MSQPIDLTQPRYNQKTYWGRAQHFIRLTNPMNFFTSDATLDQAKKIVEDYKFVCLYTIYIHKTNSCKLHKSI